MGKGPKSGAQRQKVSKHLRSATKKKFRASSAEGLRKYQEKMANRAARKLKKRR